MRPCLTISTVTVFQMLATLVFSTLGQQGSVTPTPSPEPQSLTTLPKSVLDAELRAPHGHSFRLSDYSGKVLVVNLWATWLGPSRLESPELGKLQKQFRSRGVIVVGLSTEDPNRSRREVRRWVRDFGVHYRIGWATPDVSLTLMQGRDAIPQTFVISRSGRIVKRFIGFNPTMTTPLLKLAIQQALNEKSNLPAQN
jgi:thiol-disulfide isomerase/thioredoxin